MTWRYLTFYGAKSHAVHENLSQEIIDDLSARDCELESDEPLVTELAIDQPGMIAADRPWINFNLAGLEITIPCEDVATFVLQCAKYELRGSPGKNYYKVHGFMKCLVLSQVQFMFFRKELAMHLLDAEQQAAEFWAGKRVYSEVLQDLAGVKADLGGHKADRFKAPKVVGKA